MSHTSAKTSSQSSGKPVVSVIVPLLDEAESLPELNRQLQAALLPGHVLEIIFVDDGSGDDSWNVIKKLCAEPGQASIKGIRFRRNYGKSAALQQGFRQASGTYVATIDADLQDDPAELPAMIELLEAGGYDLVSGWKQNRQDPVSKTIPSLLFNKITAKVSGIKLHDFNCGLKLYRADLVRNLNLYGEMHRYIPLLAHWEGYGRITEKPVKHHARKYGQSKFGLSRFINGFLDLLTIMFMRSFQQRPMHFFGTAGFLSILSGSAITIYLVFMKLVFDEFLARRPLLLFGIVLIVVGFQFFSIGLFGEMMLRNRNKSTPSRVAEQASSVPGPAPAASG
ncbi:MAG: glycosyltransferase family 2 protein [Cyclonatronaceae bacterium]